MSKTDIVKTNVDRFVTVLQQGYSNIEEAARIYVETIDSAPDSKQKFMERLPSFPSGLWLTLEGIGRKVIDSRLLFSGGSIVGKLRRLPFSEQKKTLDDGVQLLTAERDAILVKLEHMDSDQLDQVFAKDHVRSLGEQRAWLESRSEDRVDPQQAESPYAIKRGCLVVYKPTRIPRNELARLLYECGK